MTKKLMIVLAVSLAIGIVVGLFAGRTPGVGAFVAAAVIGAVIVVLRRNQQDLRDLEAGLAIPEVEDALGHAPPPPDPERPIP
jgi:ABC-type branched-subunit amino acid transport system permease subunit